jgi:hypothetical protein
MRFAINPFGQATHHGPSGLGEAAANPIGH